MVGLGLPGGRAAAARDPGGARRRARSRRAPRAVPRPRRSRRSQADIDHLRQLGITRFFVYQPFDIADGRLGRAPRPRRTGIQLLRADHAGRQAAQAGFDGVYTYDVLLCGGGHVRRLCAQAHRVEPLVPAVGRARATTRRARPRDLRVKPRRDGATYDAMWRAAIRSSADGVTITSYNEWHEGTQIEPARARRPAQRRLPASRATKAPTAARPARRARVPRPHGASGRTRSCGRGACAPGGTDQARRRRRPSSRRRARPGRRPASTPRERGVVEVDRRRRASARGRARPRPRRSRSEQRLDRDRRCGGRSRGARSPRARAAPRAGRCGRSSRSRCRSRSRARSSASTGAKPSPRFASVVGQRQTRAPASASRSSSCVVGVRGVDDGRARARGSPCGRAARSGGRRARRGTPRSRAAARRRGRGAASPRRPRSAPISSSQSAGQARTEWGATPTRIAGRAQRLDLAAGNSAALPAGSGGCPPRP